MSIHNLEEKAEKRIAEEDGLGDGGVNPMEDEVDASSTRDVNALGTHVIRSLAANISSTSIEIIFFTFSSIVQSQTLASSNLAIEEKFHSINKQNFFTTHMITQYQYTKHLNHSPQRHYNYNSEK